MKSTHYGTSALALIMGVALLAPTANAQLLDTSVQGSAGIGIDAATPAGSAGTDTSVTSDTAVIVPAVTATDASLNTDVTADAAVEEESSEPFTMKVSQRDVRNGEEMRNGAVERADDVRSNNSLASFAGTLMRNDRNLSSVEFKDAKMDVRYKQDAKFLGFIPASMNVKVTVDEKGMLDVTHPWYSFLMSSEVTAAELETALTADISAWMTGSSNESTAVADTSATADAGTVAFAQDGTISNESRARILERLQLALEAGVTAGAAAS